LAEALERVRARLAAPAPPAAAGPAREAAAEPSGARLAQAARGAGRPAERIVVKDGAQIHVLPLERVDYVEAQDDYVAIHEGGRAHLKHQPLAELAESLDPERFVRIHRSFVANVDRIARIELLAKDQRVAVLRDGR